MDVTIKAIPHPLLWINKPILFSVDYEDILITAGEKTDMFRAPNASYNIDNAPRLMFEADDNFVLSVSIEHLFTNKWDAGAVVIESDSLNWIKFCFEKDYTGAKRVVSVVTKNTSDDCNSMEIESNRIFYKVAKSDNVIILYYSTDGARWFLVRHLQFNTKPGFKVGFLAQSPAGDNCEVRFSNIQYQSKKINDPYIGE